ncbi:P-loop containing nucleoside triphosphate hydrolase protein [Hygrophoropsis aurantiaca]|uniref:P-loop containing nucleoside triphosphate hydrolase protein n=1 Tax=Hygrophoropsis aurantiaca TaxID=72124 RepID=A0ACB7ZY75_9AGAM|nr:P-loop containing nucleoside triphosphate hydrolase protein [Hygrophoropsis aurantiaca]
MSLFFATIPTLKAPFIVKNSTKKDGLYTVLIGPDLWKSLSFQEVEYAAISISGWQDPSRDSSGTSLPENITTRASLDAEIQGLAIPPELIATHKHIFAPSFSTEVQKLLSITPVVPAALSEVVLSARSHNGYIAAESHASILESWLCDESVLVRDGQCLTIPMGLLDIVLTGEPALGCQYTVDLALPCGQGYCKRGFTRILVMLPNVGESLDTAESSIIPENSPEYDSEDIEISECFLLNSATSDSCPSSTQTSQREYRPNNAVFGLEPLLKPISALQDDCAVYLRTVDLNQIGLLNGDWAVINSEALSRARLVRVFAQDKLVSSSGVAMISPSLLFNLCSDKICPVSLKPCPSEDCRPPIPIAKSITVARVSSAFANDRRQEPTTFHALQTYFNSGTRLVKRGDIITICIDTDVVTYDFPLSSRFEETYHSAISAYPTFSSRAGNATIQFIVTDVQLDLVMPQKGHTSDKRVCDIVVGDGGSWVDHQVTRVIQTGLEHHRVPDPMSYLNPKILASRSPSLSSSTCTNQLLHVSNSSRIQDAAAFDSGLAIMLKGSRGSGKFTSAALIAHRLGMHLTEVNCYEVISENDLKTEGFLRARVDQAIACAPCVLILRHIEALFKTTQSESAIGHSSTSMLLMESLAQVQMAWRHTGHPIIVIATTSDTTRMPSDILGYFRHEIMFDAPSETDRLKLLEDLTTNVVLTRDVSLTTFAIQTAGLVPGDLTDIVNRAQIVSLMRSNERQYISPSWSRDQSLCAIDFDTSLHQARSFYVQSIGAPKIPSVMWDDIGGLAAVRNDILDTVQLPLEHPELFSDGLKKRSGILLYGPPGTGKTLLAKAVATSCSLNFFSVKGPELLNMYIGESEANVRRIFQHARDAKPCVIFFDELDSVAPNRGNQGDSGGVMDRIVSQLLAELDGMSTGSDGMDVFVIGATNRPDLLDPALLRPGRFDRMLYLGISETHEAQYDILCALSRKFHLDSDLDLHSIANQCSFNFTGADFYALCADAMLNALSRKIEAIEVHIAKLNQHPEALGHLRLVTPQYYLAEMAGPGDINVLVSQQDFDHALDELVPSVSQSEIDHYNTIKLQFSSV